MPTATEVFAHINGYWEKTAVPTATAMKPDMDPADLARLADKFLCVCRDETVDGHEMAMREVVIDGHDKMCVRGTVLDIEDPNSLIYPAYKKAATLAKNILNLCTGGPNGGTVTLLGDSPVVTKDPQAERYRHLCAEFCIGCASGDLTVCVPELKKHVVETFAESGHMRRAIERAETNLWRNSR